jgi:hypothetical protein
LLSAFEKAIQRQILATRQSGRSGEITVPNQAKALNVTPRPPGCVRYYCFVKTRIS